jgi:hypothetical protein
LRQVVGGGGEGGQKHRSENAVKHGFWDVRGDSWPNE